MNDTQSGESVDHQKRLKIARHEVGHAVMALLCHEKVKSISLKEKDSPNGTDKYLGTMDIEPSEQKSPFTINDLNRKILISLAGFAGDELFSDITNFGGDDVDKAAKWVKYMLEIESFRNFVAGLPAPFPVTLKLTGNDLVARYIDYMMKCCSEILEPLKPQIQFIADKLYEKEELTKDEVYALAKQVGLEGMEINVQRVFSRGNFAGNLRAPFN